MSLPLILFSQTSNMAIAESKGGREIKAAWGAGFISRGGVET